MSALSQTQEKPRFKIPDTLLKKTEIRARIISQKIISGTDYLNSQYGLGKWAQTWLFDKVNLYLNKDNLPLSKYRTFCRYLSKLNNLSVSDKRVFTSLSSGLGKDKGSTFLAITHKDASHLINSFFYQKKMASLEARKMASLEARKMASLRYQKVAR